MIIFQILLKNVFTKPRSSYFGQEDSTVQINPALSYMRFIILQQTSLARECVNFSTASYKGVNVSPTTTDCYGTKELKRSKISVGR